jgi:hypothetical protein
LNATSTPIVMAKIHASGDVGAWEARYNIKIAPSTSRDYFLVFDPWPTGVTEEKDEVLVTAWHLYGINLAQGSTKATVFEASSGTYRICTMTHDSYERLDGARFMTCRQANRLSRLRSNAMVSSALKQRGQSLFQAVGAENAAPSDTVELQRLLKSLLDSRPTAGGAKVSSQTLTAWTRDIAETLVDDPNAPAWMTCGVGCCTADDPAVSDAKIPAKRK